jgi:6-phospho-3-hexuloisomerase
MSTYEMAGRILSELDRILRQVDEAEIDGLCRAIVTARRVFVHSLGREGLAVRGFAMRLAHLGVPVAVVGDMTTPRIGPGDVFLLSCGPGYLGTFEALMGIARQAGATIVMLTAEPDAVLPRQADHVVYLPAQTMARAEGSASGQAMGSAYEQALWLLFDALVPRLQTELSQSPDDMRARHTNLE